MPSSLPDPVALGRAVRAIRDERGISQVRLSENSGLQRGWLSNLEHGKRNPNFANVVRRPAGLGVRPAELVARAETLADEPSHPPRGLGSHQSNGSSAPSDSANCPGGVTQEVLLPCRTRRRAARTQGAASWHRLRPAPNGTCATPDGR